MSDRRSSFVQLLVRLFALAMRLYPAGVRRELAAEMQVVFRLKVADAAQQSAWTLFITASREARDLPPAIVSAHLHADRGFMNAYFPATSDRTPWPAALLSLLPFIIAGPVRIVLSYQPGWDPGEASLLYLWFLLMVSLSVAGGLALGAAKKFPRWAYPYPVFLAFSIYLLGRNAASLLRVDIVGNSFLTTLVFILIVLWLPGLRSFYTNITQDWTLLSYALYGIVLYLLATIDYDEYPRLTLAVLLPSLLSLCTALAHLRIRSAFTRIAALLAGTFIGLFVWLLPIFLGMVSIVIGIIMGTFMLLLYGISLAAILLAPMLVTRAIRSWRASHSSG